MTYEQTILGLTSAWILIGCILALITRKKYAELIDDCTKMWEKAILFIYMIPLNMIFPIFYIFYKTGILKRSSK